jgi:leucyl-tRNA synthetase
MTYEHQKIEAKWQKRWSDNNEFRTENDFSKKKTFILIEFPYPSGAGLHVGHPRSYTALDIVARKRRMEGDNVLYPIGFDAFGLPAENYAIKTGIHPAISTEANINNFRRQLKALGFSFDWSREVKTCDAEYYKWTQWMFLQFFNEGLAYKANLPINWCVSCKVALANEEVVDGACERCRTPTVKKDKSQWMMRITKYADRLIEDLNDVNYIEPVKLQQINWIGKSHGAEINFAIAGSDEKLSVFTTRPDTLFGATYMVVAPEHSLVKDYAERIENIDEVLAYKKVAAHKSDMERTELAKDKTGVPLKGLAAINPATGKEIPIWVSDYVLISYGTGAIMAVPGHDQRDWEFAKQFGLQIIEVIEGGDISEAAYTDNVNGVLVNSELINGLKVPEAKAKMIDWLLEKGLGEGTVNYKLRDWVFSRQRYWGEPIPLVECDDCGWVPLPEDQLPLLLPEIEDYKPADSGASPLAKATDWINTECPKCGKPARRETDTMPQWAGSCWYFMRYLDPHNDKEFCAKDLLDYWMPVDWYNGGMEHTTLHLLYSRFWYKFMYDKGLVPTSEPYARRTSHGLILGNDGEKMSKSRGNVVNPDDVVDKWGADTFRLYELKLGAFEKATPWKDSDIVGVHRFLRRTWALFDKASSDALPTDDDRRLMHQTIRKVDERVEGLKFNTAVSALDEYLNGIAGKKVLPLEMLELMLVLLGPFAPHIACELWEKLGHTESLTYYPWPTFDPELAKEQKITVPVQVNGKLRDTLELDGPVEEEELFRLALACDGVQRQLQGDEPRRIINVKGKLVNIVK